MDDYDELEKLAAEFLRRFRPSMDITNTKIVTVRPDMGMGTSINLETALVQNYIDKLGKDKRD